jgi:hypothetical protein
MRMSVRLARSPKSGGMIPAGRAVEEEMVGAIAAPPNIS